MKFDEWLQTTEGELVSPTAHDSCLAFVFEVSQQIEF